MSANSSTAWLRAPGQTDDKYTRGVLGVRTGDPKYPGAAVLGVTAAWRTGIGMVRYVPPVSEERAAAVSGLTAPAAAVLSARPETVFGAGMADAWLLGSGTDPTERSFGEREALIRLLRGSAPVVVDAGALELAAEIALEHETTPMVLTPHRGEFERVWGLARLGPLPADWPEGREAASVETLADTAGTLAKALGVTVLLKGSTTVAATPAGEPRIVEPATPWLATAGTGDVLAGILGGLVASHAGAVRQDPELLGALGALATTLHDGAARAAVGHPAGPITALDVAEAIPRAIAAMATN